jgi:hypothetical protein
MLARASMGVPMVVVTRMVVPLVVVVTAVLVVHRQLLPQTCLAISYEQQSFRCWIGGHLTSPKEQKTQQSPAVGLSTTRHARHS